MFPSWFKKNTTGEVNMLRIVTAIAIVVMCMVVFGGCAV